MFVFKAAVLGGGTMGGEIAQVIANADIPVVVKDVEQKFVDHALEKSREVTRSQLDKLVSKEKMTEEQADARLDEVMGLITGTTTYDGFGDVDFVIEAVPERMEIKKSVYRELDEVTPGHAILASNTSSLSITEMGRETLRPGQVVGVPVGDEALDAVDVPGAVGLRDCLGASRTHIGPRIGFGEHHGGAPVALDRHCGPALLLLISDVVEDVGKDRADEIHEGRGLSAQRKLADRPGHHRRRRHAADGLGETDAEPLPLLPGAERPLEGLGKSDGVRVWVERRRVTVSVRERFGQRSLGQPCGLAEHLAHRVAVKVTELAGGEHLLEIEHL